MVLDHFGSRVEDLANRALASADQLTVPWSAINSQMVSHKYFFDFPPMEKGRLTYNFPGAQLPLHQLTRAISDLLEEANEVGRVCFGLPPFNVVGFARFRHAGSHIPVHSARDPLSSDPDKHVLSLSLGAPCTYTFDCDTFRLPAGAWLCLPGRFRHGVEPGCEGRVSVTFKRFDRVPGLPSPPLAAGLGR